MHYAIDPGFDEIRTTLQSALALPFVICVTSSQAADGKTSLSVGTARAFARAGFETLIVDANPLAPGVAQALGLKALPSPPTLDSATLTITPAGGLLSAASIATHRLADDAKPADVRAFAQHLRTAYNVTIVDLSEVFFGDFAVHWCAAADGVVIAARYARFADDDDHRLVATLEHAGATIVGCVPTSFPERS